MEWWELDQGATGICVEFRERLRTESDFRETGLTRQRESFQKILHYFKIQGQKNLESELAEEPPVLSLCVSLLESLLDGLSGLLPLGWVGNYFWGNSHRLEVNIDGVTENKGQTRTTKFSTGQTEWA
eukprot:765298-Hanusia_phi.AAC.5